ncbi:hypothetical protein SAMN05216582_10548 [Selenomonas ruminantium]|uniref:Uncharacterized protein n=1 Tax=Selenomonas ruminantium TaxID=971 RepID=A0A1M6SSL7_SELRU|nr:hypothetical protein [Selenomonas ruminantium]SHK47675.1 hypothetical protein SAMN05216582_10548 [Selenomonas ruminantium]
MSYASGFMMGTALVQGLGSMLMGGGAAGVGAAATGMMGASKMMGAGRMMGSGSRMLGSRGGAMGGRSMSSQGFEMPDINLGKFLKPVEPFKLESDLPGRRRYRAAAVSAELAKLLEEKLAKLDYIETIKVNAESGSILLTFAVEDAGKIDALAKWMAEKLFTAQVPTAAQQGGAVSKMPEAQAGIITRSIRGTVRAISNWIKDHTGGLFDMSSLASLLFLLRGFRKMFLTGQYPSGSQMLWWAVTLMRGWRTV